MRLKDYQRHLVEELCWVCHRRTGPSSGRQKQCQRCRRKWSYRQRQVRWNLLRLFATAITPAEAARRLKVSYRTAWSHFLRFERTLRQTRNQTASSFLAYRTDIQKGRMPWCEIAPDQDIVALLYESESREQIRGVV